MQEIKQCRGCSLHKRNNRRLFEELAENEGRLLQEVLCRGCNQTPWAEWELLEAKNIP